MSRESRWYPCASSCRKPEPINIRKTRRVDPEVSAGGSAAHMVKQMLDYYCGQAHT